MIDSSGVARNNKAVDRSGFGGLFLTITRDKETLVSS